MKKVKTEGQQDMADDMLPEYDFRGGVRGKHAQALRQGYTVRIHEEDGTTTIQHFPPTGGAVVLDPDVRKYFPDSEAVNKALRMLIQLIPRRRRTRSGKS